MRSALDYRAANHPEIIARTDALLSGIYKRLGVLCKAQAPDADAGSPITALTSEYLLDIESYPAFEAEQERIRKKQSGI